MWRFSWIPVLLFFESRLHGKDHKEICHNGSHGDLRGIRAVSIQRGTTATAAITSAALFFFFQIEFDVECSRSWTGDAWISQAVRLGVGFPWGAAIE